MKEFAMDGFLSKRGVKIIDRKESVFLRGKAGK